MNRSYTETVSGPLQVVRLAKQSSEVILDKDDRVRPPEPRVASRGKTILVRTVSDCVMQSTG